MLTFIGDRYSSCSSRSPSPRPRRRKSLSEQALSALGGVFGAACKHDDRDDYDYDRDYRGGRSRGREGRRHRSYSCSVPRSRSRGRHAKREDQLAQAVKAALVAGAAEAFRARKDPGSWTGEKGKRVLTAAISAGGVDGLIDRDPNRHGGRHVVESVLAGLATNYLVNGGRSKSKLRRSSGSGLKDLAASGILAATDKQVYDRMRSKSRGRGRGRDRSSDSYDGASPPRRRGDGHKRRSSSVSEYINKGLAALGLEDREDDSRRRRHRRERSSRYSEESDDDEYREDYRSSRCRRSSRDVRGGSMPGQSSSRSTGRDSDLGSSDEEKRERKKMLRKEMLTTGLATVATIHAAHTVMKGLEGRKKRQQQLKEGQITAEEARKRRTKADLMDAASVGLAAVGIAGAIDQWWEVQKQRRERQKFVRDRHKKRMRRARSALAVALTETGTRTRTGWEEYGPGLRYNRNPSN